ncbi:hypothetical protein J5868_01250 [Candidatus Saccharibacteria bacterium]|nr:hypothetical protein [Candidatus Saccharibacteria bacterium]
MLQLKCLTLILEQVVQITKSLKSSNTLEKDRILYIMVLSLISLTTISGLVLSSPILSAHADDSVVTTTAVTVSESCSMTATVGTPHSASLPNGTYSGTSYPNGVGTTTLRAFCNDRQGFAIYAIGYTGDEYGNNKLHSNTLGNDYDINTGIYTSGSTTNSTWSMKLSSVAGDFAPTITDGTNNTENFTTWHVVPSEYTKVAYRTTGTDILVGGSGTGSSVEVTYDAYISSTQPAGTYVGQVKYTLVHPSTAGKPVTPLKDSDCPAGYVCYAPNTSDIEGSMSSLGSISSSPTAGKISVGTSATTINLIAPNYKREGYGFAGWSTDFTTTNASTIYGPNETLTVPSATLATKGMILYPVWVASSGTLQEFSCASSSLTPATYNSTTGKVSATLSSITALTDSRDGNVYAVAKLADGYCWMIENLRLDANHSTDGSLAQGYDTGFIGLPDSEDANFDTNGTANNLYSTGNYRTMPRYNNNNIKFGGKNASGTDLVAGYNTNTNTAQWYSYGNYYSWPAAKATITNYESYSATDAVSTSICPAGWILPLGYQSTGALDDNEQSSTWRVRGFSYLDRIMGGTGQNSSTNSVTNASNSANWRSFPNNFVYSGYWDGAQASTRSSSGFYWSSSANSNGRAYGLGLSSSVVYPGTNYYVKYYGFTVRCVAGS